MAPTGRKRIISDGNGGQIEVDVSIAMIHGQLAVINTKMDGIENEIAGVKDQIGVLFKKHEDLAKTIHQVDKETAIVMVKSEENTNTRRLTLRGFISAVASAIIGGLAGWFASQGGK